MLKNMLYVLFNKQKCEISNNYVPSKLYGAGWQVCSGTNNRAVYSKTVWTRDKFSKSGTVPEIPGQLEPMHIVWGVAEDCAGPSCITSVWHGVIAERISARYLILQHALGQCMIGASVSEPTLVV